MPARGIHHVDLAVSDVDRSVASYLELLGPLGLEEDSRYATYRGTEEAVYVSYGEQLLGLRPADGGEHRYYEVGIEHIAFYVDTRAEVDQTYERSLAMGGTRPLPARAGPRSPGLLRAVRLRSRRHPRRGRLRGAGRGVRLGAALSRARSTPLCSRLGSVCL